MAVADRVLMLENAMYSVISPEGCASIMWRDALKRAMAAEALKTTSEDVMAMGCVDDVVPEPPGGAHLDPDAAARMLDEKLTWHLNELKAMSTEARLAARRRSSAILRNSSPSNTYVVTTPLTLPAHPHRPSRLRSFCIFVVLSCMRSLRG